MLNRLGVDHTCDRQTDKQTDRVLHSIEIMVLHDYSADKPISIKSTLCLKKGSTKLTAVTVIRVWVSRLKV